MPPRNPPKSDTKPKLPKWSSPLWYLPIMIMVNEHRDQLEAVTQKLLETETLDARAFNQLIGRSPKQDERRPLASVDIAPHPVGSGNGHQTPVE